MTRYIPSRNYLWAGAGAFVLAGVSGLIAWNWTPAAIPMGLFLASAGLLIFLALRPRVEIDQDALLIGKRVILWEEIRRVDRSGWISPLVLYLTLEDGKRVILIFPGDLDSSNSLLRHIRRHSREALIDGVPYRKFWGNEAPAVERRTLPSPKYQLLRPDDEAEVERLFHQLKTAGHLDPKNTPDEK